MSVLENKLIVGLVLLVSNSLVRWLRSRSYMTCVILEYIYEKVFSFL